MVDIHDLPKLKDWRHWLLMTVGDGPTKIDFTPIEKKDFQSVLNAAQEKFMDK